MLLSFPDICVQTLQNVNDHQKLRDDYDDGQSVLRHDNVEGLETNSEDEPVCSATALNGSISYKFICQFPGREYMC